MPQLVNENERGKSEPEFLAVERPIDAHKRRQADQEIQLEDGEENLGLRQGKRHGRQRPQFSGPSVPGLRLRCGFWSRRQTIQLAENPLCLGRLTRQKRKGMFPTFTRLCELALLLEGLGLRRPTLQRLSVHQSMAPRAGKGGFLELGRAALAGAHGWNEYGGHDVVRAN
ncbi:hypothetical protein SBA2_220003 [Acidobacteriia bacterium SbA2]|nr:hypothetical protein SBA2_220003 [Acidobacteriia bacterium SbA2]